LTDVFNKQTKKYMHKNIVETKGKRKRKKERIQLPERKERKKNSQNTNKVINTFHKHLLFFFC